MKQIEREKDRWFLFSLDMLCTLGYDGYFRSVNPAFQETLGFTEADFLERSLIEFVHPVNVADVLEEFSKLKKGASVAHFENRCRHEDGFYRWLNWTAYSIPEENLIYALARDITQEREAEETLKKMAFTDALTGLFNRRGFQIVAERMEKISHRKKMGLLLMVGDLDNMKSINDNFGHREGDLALIAAARILQDRFRDSDIVARLGGDEFVAVLLTDSKDRSAVIQESLEHSFAEHSRQKKYRYSLSLSMGFAYASWEERMPFEKLMARADHAMYEWKRSRRVA